MNPLPPCPCGLPSPYKTCCGQHIEEQEKLVSPEPLMRCGIRKNLSIVMACSYLTKTIGLNYITEANTNCNIKTLSFN